MGSYIKTLSKKKVELDSTYKAGDIVVSCVHCGNTATKSSYNRKFYQSNVSLNKYTDRFPLCKDCIVELSTDEKSFNLNKFKEVLKFANRPYLESIMEMSYSIVNKGLEKEGKNPIDEESIRNTLGGELAKAYFIKIGSLSQFSGLGFDDSENTSNERRAIENDYEITDDIVSTWGYGMADEDYIFLEKELSEWKKTHKCDNRAELTLLREICLTILDISKAREQGRSTKDLKKELQDLMKTANVDPAKATVANSDKAMEAWGCIIETIEKEEPAEFFRNKSLYKDFDSIVKYAKDHFYRPIKNLLTGSRDFDVGDE